LGQAGHVLTEGGGQVAVAWEARRDRHQYRFDYPSRFDTPFTVPHVVRQDYDADNHWLVARAGFRAAARRWTSEAAVAFWGSGVGQDYDTFWQPDGDVVVYGTTAETAQRSFRVAQRVELGTVAGLTTNLGYVYRRDRARFVPSDSITRHSRPPSETRAFNAARETTFSDVHDVLVGVSRRVSAGQRWTLTIAAEASPLTTARLNTVLPDKYPGRDIVLVARAFSAAPSVALSVGRGRLRASARVDYARSWPYGRANRFTRDWLGVSVIVGFAGR
jgi:hypothetical protein